jgi:hypothetical protein
MTTKKNKNEDPVIRVILEIAVLKDRIQNLERALRIIGREFEKTHLSGIAAHKWASRAIHLSNAMRAIRTSIRRNGNELDKPPYLPDPEKDLTED